jgi:transposase InsO family protein
MPNYDPQQVALFRYQVIAPLVSVSGPRGTLKREMERIAARSHEHPYRGPTRYGLGTIEEWHYLYQREGLDGLLPAARRDRGRSRVIDEQTAERIEALAQSRPNLDARGILAELRCGLEDHNHKLPSLSSLYRFLRARGLDQRRTPRRQDHRAYAFDLAGDCWQGDVMYGPGLTTPRGTRRKTYLIALLDDATRLVPHAQFYFEQHLRSLKDCLKQALLKRGVPRRLYLDNGKIFRSRLLLGLCARLGIELIHSRPYRPQGRAKIERFFGTVRRTFLARLDADRIEDIDGLNRLLFAWIEGNYHVTPHRGIEGETPLDRWLRLSGGIRPLGREVDLDELFWDQTTRRVAKDGTLSLHGRILEAGPTLIGQRVTVRFDPFDLRRVVIITPDEQTQQAFPVDLEANRRLRRHPPPEPQERPPVALEALQDLANQMEKRQNPDQDKENPDE